MRVGNYSLMISEGVERSSGHVEIAHGTKFTLRLNNNQSRRCTACVTLDGKTIGEFRLDGWQQMSLERAPHDPGCFTFYKADTGEAAAGGVANVARMSRGLVEVVFTPEKRSAPAVVRMAGCVKSMNASGAMPDAIGIAETGFDEELTSQRMSRGAPMNFAPGITGLSGRSNQSFMTVPDMDVEASEAVTITLRLVAPVDEPRELTSAPRGNPIPAVVG